MRFAVLGCGSIGSRHIGNLQMLGQKDIVAFDPDSGCRQAAVDNFGIRAVASLGEIWDAKPDVVLVTSPPDTHLELSTEAAERGCHLFIEKPLSDQIEGLDQLVKKVKANRLITLVACNMRFHPGPASIKRLLEENAIGTIISGHLDAGQYMPDWHPDQDYRNRYSANRSMGGGVIFDGIHEIDCARWLFGEVDEVFCYGGKRSSLEIDVEDSADILMKLAAGHSAVVHIDYIQRFYARQWKVIGEEGTIEWDIANHLRWYTPELGKWQTRSAPKDYSMNEMYIAEMTHFLACLEEREESILSVSEAAKVMLLALAVKESMVTGKKVVL